MSFLSAEFAVYAVLSSGLLIWLDNGRWKCRIIGVISAGFYAWEVPENGVILVGLAILAFLFARFVDLRRFGWAALALLLLPLVLLKYDAFLLGQGGLGLVGLAPLGISFFTFQNISYVVDVRRGLLAPETRFSRYFAYISFFPQLVAGPIVTGRQLLPQLKEFQAEGRDVRRGVGFLVSGYLKKALIADRLALIADPVFAGPGQASSGLLWLGLVAYSLQIYCDFSGYSDIAIGLGRLFGLRLPENFRYPYKAQGFQDFWRRWHITLSTWLRDYLYIPLGGSRQGPVRLFSALLVTMLLGGLWHGPHWNFVLWGLGHGLLLWVERQRPISRARDFFGGWPYRLFTLAMIGLLWVLFRAGSEPAPFETASFYYKGLFMLQMGEVATRSALLWVLACLGGLLAMQVGGRRISRRFLRLAPIWQGYAVAVLVAAMLLMAPGRAAFIYFVF